MWNIKLLPVGVCMGVGGRGVCVCVGGGGEAGGRWAAYVFQILRQIDTLERVCCHFANEWRKLRQTGSCLPSI